jgi:NAD(P)-dependent dehydrogenase (short-subunit alcohol dehydrogenase family)
MKNQLAAVLGLGPALGASVARRFAKEGFSVALMARSPSSLASVQAEIEAAGARALSVPTDATDPESVKKGFEQVRTELGTPDVLVYNAGAFQFGGILEVTPQQFDDCWKANCAGAFYAAQQVLPDMLERGRGTLLFTGATAALRGSARFSLLAVGKFGLRALSQSIAREFGPRGIHVAHVVIDGQIDTPRMREAQPERDASTLLSPDAIADAYFQLHTQSPTAWTLELDLRPAVEKF